MTSEHKPDLEILKCWPYSNVTSINHFIAWDETAANTIGIYPTYEEAIQALHEYAATLDKGGLI